MVPVTLKCFLVTIGYFALAMLFPSWWSGVSYGLKNVSKCQRNKNKSTIIKHKSRGRKREDVLVSICLCWVWGGVHLLSFGNTFIFITISGIKGDYGEEWWSLERIDLPTMKHWGRGSERVHYGSIIKGCEMKVHQHLLSPIKGGIGKKKGGLFMTMTGGKRNDTKDYISQWLTVKCAFLIGQKASIYYNCSSNNSASCRSMCRLIFMHCFNMPPFVFFILFGAKNKKNKRLMKEWLFVP